jgi:hypothetical protein
MGATYDSYTDYLSSERRRDNSKGNMADLDNFVDQLVEHLQNCGNEFGEDVCLCNLHRSAANCIQSSELWLLIAFRMLCI